MISSWNDWNEFNEDVGMIRDWNVQEEYTLYQFGGTPM